MKKALIALAVVVVLVIAAGVAIPFLIPTETIKGKLVEGVKSATGRDLAINGPIKLSLFPTVAVEATQVSFSNAPGGQAKAMATLGKLQVDVKLLPLISKEIEIDSFVLVDPVIALEIDKQGKPNWVFGDAAAAKPDAKAKPAQGGGSAGGGVGLSDIRLGDVRLSNGTVTYLDQRTGAKEEITGINMKLALPDLDQPFKGSGDLTWKGKKISLTMDAAKPRVLLEGKGSTAIAAKVQAETVNFDYKGEIAMGAPPKVTGDIDLNVPSLRNLAAWVGNPIQMQGSGLGPLSIKGKLDLAGPKMAFNNAAVAIDAIKATGGVQVDSSGARPKIAAKLDVDKLDLNPYLPPEGAKGAGSGAGGSGDAAKPAAASQGWSDDPIDLAALKAADADLALSVGGIQMRKIQIGKGVVAAKLADGRLAADLTQLALYQGEGKGRVVLDGSKPGSNGLELTFNLAKVQAEPLLKDVADFDRLSGAGAFDLAVTGHGKSQREIVNALNGNGKIDFHDGAIKGINLASMVRNVGSAFTGGAANEKTDFSQLGGTFTITNGILKNTDLALQSPLIRVVGAGTADLPHRTVDYKVTPKLVASLEGQGGQGALGGVAVPVLVQGPWDHISYKPDLAGLIQNVEPGKLLDEVKGLKNAPAGVVQGLTGGATGGTGGATVPAGKPADVLKGLLGR